MNLARKASVLGFVTVALLVGVGCSAAPDDGSDDSDVATGAATPDQVTNVFEQVKVCDNLFKDRAAFRDVDLQEGVLRWKCGDVDRVTISKCEDDLAALAAAEKKKKDVTEARRDVLNSCGDGYGQEYCEYNAIAKGNVVNSIKQAKTLKDADAVQCVFTSVHSDFKGDDAEAFADELASTLKGQIIAADRVPEGRVAGMKQSVNSRGAADALIFDCANLARTGVKFAKDNDRQVLCYNAWSKATTPAAKAKLEATCSNVDLSDDAKWAKVGIAQTALSDTDKDLAACSMVAREKTVKDENGKPFQTIIGVSWRNSDPTICARSYRAASECKVAFKEIGNVAASLPGFSIQGWTSRNTLPTGCKYVTVDNKPFAQLVVCTANPQDVKNYRTQKKPLQTLCRDKFGINVAMQAPIGALADLKTAKEETPFCKAFVAGARKAQGGATPAKQ
jgi:hypothetical protein